MTSESKPPGVAAPRDTALDGVRGLACLMIFFYHTGVEVVAPPFVVLGTTGVSAFFVLSGYLMFGPFLAAILGERPWPASLPYAIRRASRIYPPYLVALVIFTIVRLAIRQNPPGAFNFATHLALVFNFFDRRDFFSINGVFWSLAVEAQFYVVLPLAAWSCRRLAGPRPGPAAGSVVVGLLAIGLGSRGAAFLATEGPDAPALLTRYMTVFSFLDLFAVGMAVALFERRLAPRLGRSAPGRGLLIAAGLALYLATNNWSIVASRGWLVGATLGYTVGFPALNCLGIGLALLGLVCRPDKARGVFTWRPLVAVGTISYSLYLYHVAVQQALALAFHIESIPFRLAFGLISLPPTLLVSTLMYLLVERPSMRLGARYSSHPLALPAAPGEARHGRTR